MKISAAALVGAVAVLVGCGFPKTGPAPGPVSPAATRAAGARWPGTVEASLASGRELFVAKCNGCHGYPDLATVSEAKWPDAMARMAKKADLTDGQREEVLHFILVSR